MLVGAFRQDYCLSYINTLSWRGRAVPVEALQTIADIFDWLERSGVLPTAAIEEARGWAQNHPFPAARAFAHAIEVREALFGIFSATAAGVGVNRDALHLFSTALGRAPRRGALVGTEEGCAWRVSATRITLREILAPVLWSAGDLVVGARNHGIRCCANDECLWLFIDRSKSNTRRWCEMGSCGNRAKSRRHYARTRRS